MTCILPMIGRWDFYESLHSNQVNQRKKPLNFYHSTREWWAAAEWGAQHMHFKGCCRLLRRYARLSLCLAMVCAPLLPRHGANRGRVLVGRVPQISRGRRRVAALGLWPTFRSENKKAKLLLLARGAFCVCATARTRTHSTLCEICFC